MPRLFRSIIIYYLPVFNFRNICRRTVGNFAHNICLKRLDILLTMSRSCFHFFPVALSGRQNWSAWNIAAALSQTLIFVKFTIGAALFFFPRWQDELSPRLPTLRTRNFAKIVMIKTRKTNKFASRLPWKINEFDNYTVFYIMKFEE